ncbi:MAG: energy transducer TonB [Prevotellaceae bacterium]|jgi:TonB family protein|nr:energy transducer TonB [Prevotellaceae bacterium]
MSSEATINREKRTFGILATLLFHSVLLITFWITTMAIGSYDVPPPRKEVLIAFEPPKEEMPKNISIFTASKTNTVGDTKSPVPRSGGAKSTSKKTPKPVTTPGKQGTKASATPDKASTAPQIAKNTVPLTSSNGANAHGDVERYDPAPDTTVTPINPYALFNPSMVNDGGASQPGATAQLLSANVFKGGGDDTQTEKSSTTVLGGPSFSLTGRSIVGHMPLPEYSQNLQGRVVVEISVDRDGRVTSAKAGVKGSTVSDAILWNAAKEAALKTKFTSSPTELVQYGTITYVFRLQ